LRRAAVTIVLFSILATLLDIFAVGLSWTHARRVARVTSGDVRALTTALKRTPEADRAAELERRAHPGSFEHLIATELHQAPSDAAKITAVNDALLDVEHTFRKGATWPRAGIRIVLAGDFVLGLSTWFTTGNVRAAMILAASGGAAALLCVEARRSATRHIAAQRADIDALITVVLGSLVDRPPPPGEQRNAWRTRPSRRRRSS
jgi:hypothetical protein